MGSGILPTMSGLDYWSARATVNCSLRFWVATSASNQLRQSPPYVGMLPREEVRRLNEEAAS